MFNFWNSQIGEETRLNKLSLISWTQIPKRYLFDSNLDQEQRDQSC